MIVLACFDAGDLLATRWMSHFISNSYQRTKKANEGRNQRIRQVVDPVSRWIHYAFICSAKTLANLLIVKSAAHLPATQIYTFPVSRNDNDFAFVPSSSQVNIRRCGIAHVIGASVHRIARKKFNRINDQRNAPRFQVFVLTRYCKNYEN